MPSLRPGNLAMMLLIGNLPTGVCAMNLSCSTSTPFSLERMYCSSLACPALPTGREPIATTSFTYCMTWLPFMSGLGAELSATVGTVVGAAVAGALALAAGFISADDAEVAGCSGLLQATINIVSRTSRERAIRAIREGAFLGNVMLGVL